MKKKLFLTLLFLSLSSLTTSAQADLFQWSFELLPADGNISGPPGSTIGWGYTIRNLDDTDWLELTGISADQFEYGTADAGIFDFPILAPGATLIVGYDGISGLYALTWDISAPIDFINSGTFILSGEWWSDDPFTGGSSLLVAEDKSQPYTATVAAAVPEPTTILLLGSGLLSIFGLRKKPSTIVQLLTVQKEISKERRR